jgi:hypothetical protein
MILSRELNPTANGGFMHPEPIKNKKKDTKLMAISTVTSEIKGS